ncbi:TRAP transporter small permease [Rhizobium halophytocola]|uniref:TRAP transporter small permease protein n=1 Tax=Rhizobium halophytocola TaxID=735519 RepID=A0ABS4E0K0_9HYPH|nr:TRAP transporter small permease subunit [Rhizobium halophytocola]MBP1851458.1 TRAP-type C4-dicarboxylate transport system permease small subunit [Rhizobium halophytocola]
MSLAPAEADDRRAAFLASPGRRAIAWLCAALLVAMMLITVADVVGRYLFNSPLPGATELTGLLLSAVIFVGLPAVCFDEEHVTVDLLVDRLPEVLARPRLLLVRLLSAAALAVISWRLFVQGQAMAGYGEQTVSLHLPVAPVAWFCAAMTAIAAAVTFATIFARPAPPAR